MKTPLEQITVDDCTVDLLALVRRRKLKRVVAHVATDPATGRVLSLHFGRGAARVEQRLRAHARRAR